MKALKELPFEITSDSATENAGRNGYNLQESAVDVDGVLPDDIYDHPIGEERDTDVKPAIQKLIELGDILDSSDEKVYADFTDLLIRKIAEENSKTPIDRFNDLILKINQT